MCCRRSRRSSARRSDRQPWKAPSTKGLRLARIWWTNVHKAQVRGKLGDVLDTGADELNERAIGHRRAIPNVILVASGPHKGRRHPHGAEMRYRLCADHRRSPRPAASCDLRCQLSCCETHYFQYLGVFRRCFLQIGRPICASVGDDALAAMTADARLPGLERLINVNDGWSRLKIGPIRAHNSCHSGCKLNISRPVSPST